MANEEKKYPTPRGAAATATKRKYNSKAYDRFELSLPKGMKEKIDEVAEVLGYKSRRSFVLDIIAEKYEQVMGKELELSQSKKYNDIPPGLEGMIDFHPEEIEDSFDDDDLPF